jgi:hypothetical protein
MIKKYRWHSRACWRGFLLIVCTLAVVVLHRAAGHEVHKGAQHVNYSNWTNKLKRSCCNDGDCHPIADGNVRISNRTEVFIEGVWCEVMFYHYLATGNAPDWSTAHVCVRSGYGDEGPCERLMCFQPKPLF